MADSARAWRELCALLACGAADLLTPPQAAGLRFRAGGDAGAGTGEMRSPGGWPGKPRAATPHAARFPIHADWAYLAAVAERAGGGRNRAEAVAAWREMGG